MNEIQYSAPRSRAIEWLNLEGREQVSYTGSPESAAAPTAAPELLGDRVGRLTLVAVAEVDDSTAGHQERAPARGA